MKLGIGEGREGGGCVIKDYIIMYVYGSKFKLDEQPHFSKLSKLYFSNETLFLS